MTRSCRRLSAVFLPVLLGWAFLWGGCLSTPPVRHSREFTFVQMCDPQLGMTDYGQNAAALTQAVVRINALAPAFVVVCGDLVAKAQPCAWEDARSLHA